MSIITNTTVLSNFASINQLDLLHRLYGTLYISTEVYEEIQVGLEEGYQFYEGIDTLVFPLAAGGWIQLTSMAEAHEFRPLWDTALASTPWGSRLPGDRLPPWLDAAHRRPRRA
jgi:hypothetical protein